MNKQFSIALKELREKAGFDSQTKFAEVCRMDNSTIARLERGETEPTPKTLTKISKVLHIPIIDLMKSAGYLIDQERGTQMTNKEKLTAAISKLLDQINESLDKKEAISGDALIALQTLVPITTYEIG